MAVRFVLDEHLRGPLGKAIQHHNALGVAPLDVVRVGDLWDLPLGTSDPDLLLWAERTGRIVVSHDRSTMPAHFQQHLDSGHHSPGVFILQKRCTLSQIVNFLVAAAYASDPLDWQDQLRYIP